MSRKLTLKVFGTCALCKDSDKKLVRSHVIPRSFYREYGKAKLLTSYGATSLASAGGKHVRTGIYGHFLCAGCEELFCRIDDKAAKLLLSGERIEDMQMVSTAPNVGFRGIRLSCTDQSDLHLFAASVLWRAAHSTREEFAQIRIGDKYDKAISHAIQSQALSDEIRNCIGVLLCLYDEANPFNGAAIIARRRRFGANAWGVQINSFQLGFPYGDLHVRLDRQRPKYGYVSFDNGCHAGLWSCNVSERFPVWCVTASPIRHDISAIVNLVTQTSRMATNH